MLFVLIATQLSSALLLKDTEAQPAGAVMVTPGTMNPVTKIVKLLEGMQKQLDEEQKADEGTYEKYQCWCETTIKEKTAALEAAEIKRGELESSIEELTATVARLTEEIANLK